MKDKDLPVTGVAGKVVLGVIGNAVDGRWADAQRTAAGVGGTTTTERVDAVSRHYVRQLVALGAAAGGTAAVPGVGTLGTEEVVTEELDHEESAQAIASSSTDAGYTLISNQETEAATEGAEEEHHTVLVPFLRPPTADINMTLAMAIVSFTAIQYYGIRSHGVWGRIKHMANPPFLFPIEVIGEFSRIISLSARLFGRMRRNHCSASLSTGGCASFAGTAK